MVELFCAMLIKCLSTRKILHFVYRSWCLFALSLKWFSNQIISVHTCTLIQIIGTYFLEAQNNFKTRKLSASLVHYYWVLLAYNGWVCFNYARSSCSSQEEVHSKVTNTSYKFKYTDMWCSDQKKIMQWCRKSHLCKRVCSNRFREGKHHYL